MKHFDLNWASFNQALHPFRQLSADARRELLSRTVQQRIPQSAITPGSPLVELVNHGFYAAASKGTQLALAPAFHHIVGTMRGMLKTRLDWTPDVTTFDQYVVLNFTRNEWMAFDSYYWPQSRQQLYKMIGSPAWLEEFMDVEPLAWEDQFRLDFEPVRMHKPTADALKKVLRHMMERPEPLHFDELFKLSANPLVLSNAITAGIRYMLLFPMLPQESCEPLIGIWPQISRQLHREPSKPPAPVKPVDTFSSPLLIDAMSAVLTACVAEPLRILAATQNGLFAKSQKQVAVRLMHLPDWIPQQLHASDDDRIQHAINVLIGFKLISAHDSGSANNYRFEVTNAGRAWLGMTVEMRLKELLDAVRDFSPKGRRPYEYPWQELAAPLYVAGQTIDTHTAVREAFARLPAGNAVRLDEFLAYESEAHNPLNVPARGSGPHNIPGWALDQPRAGDFEQHWAGVLFRTFDAKLVPYGAVEIGYTDEGRLTIALNDPGRYLLGLSGTVSLRNPEPAGAIVVQPNFEIVFLAPSAYAQADLSNFTERHGKHVGSVLRITKKSVWAAAAAGISADDVITKLRTHSSVPVPANVEREIRGWMKQCRVASIRPALLIHCPDADTATQILAIDRNRLQQITSTVLELNEPAYRPKLVKKLRELGIFV